MPLASPTLSGPCFPRNGRPSRHYPQQPGGLNLNLRLFTRARTLWVAVHFNMGLDGARSAHSFAPGPAGGPAAAASGRTSPRNPPCAGRDPGGTPGNPKRPQNFGVGGWGLYSGAGGAGGPKTRTRRISHGLGPAMRISLQSENSVRRTLSYRIFPCTPSRRTKLC